MRLVRPKNNVALRLGSQALQDAGPQDHMLSLAFYVKRDLAGVDYPRLEHPGYPFQERCQ